VEVELATACAGFDTINGLTISHGDGKSTFLLDNIHFY
jgi:hypothetical protein